MKKNEIESADADDFDEPRLVRLNKFLADHGVASRRRCDELIENRKVSVDGEVVTELGLKIDPEKSEVEVDGFVFKAKAARKRYYVLNKPSGVVCTNEPRETRPRAVDLITDPFKGRIYTVGRLDEESKGLIVLTNDGEFAHRIQHPKYGIEKTYLVKVAGEIDDATLKEVREGVHLSEGRTAGARIVVHERGRDYSMLSITIREGMNREIRRVFARFGFKVLELKRIRIGTLTDRGLKPGRWRELLREEVKALLEGDKPVRASDEEPARRGGKPQSDRRGPARGKNAHRPRGEAPLGKPKTKPRFGARGYARHLVHGGRAVERRPDAPPRFGEEPQRESSALGRDGRIHGRVSGRPKNAGGASARPKSGGSRGFRGGPAPKPKVGRKQRGER